MSESHYWSDNDDDGLLSSIQKHKERKTQLAIVLLLNTTTVIHWDF